MDKHVIKDILKSIIKNDFDIVSIEKRSGTFSFDVMTSKIKLTNDVYLELSNRCILASYSYDPTNLTYNCVFSLTKEFVEEESRKIKLTKILKK